VSSVAVIGNLSRDVVAGGATRPGGAVFYAARAFARIGAEAHVVARCSTRDASLLLPPLEALGVPVAFRTGAHTAAFTFHYEGDNRVMHVDEIGDPWTPADVTDEWVEETLGDARWVQVGALLRTDFVADTLAALARGGRRLLVDAQGLVRLAQVGPLLRDAEVDPKVFASLAALKLSENEARILGQGVEPSQLRKLGVAEIVVTLGSAGALIVTPSTAERIAPVPIDGVVDPTGAGDSFSAGYLHARAQGADPVEAARAANALAAELMVRESA
jgi:sugar/nucleoside kinase (ribokinase family)